MRTARDSSRRGSASVHAWMHPNPLMWAFWPPSCGPGDPPSSQTPQPPPRCGPEHLQGMLGYPLPCGQKSWHTLLKILPVITRMHSSRMRIGHSLPYGGDSVQGGPQSRGSPSGGSLSGRTPPHLWTEWQTGVKTLPCPKLRLRAVTRLFLTWHQLCTRKQYHSLLLWFGRFLHYFPHLYPNLLL